MSRPWLKSWVDILDNPKVMGLAGGTYKVWSCCLHIACRHDRDGLLPSLDKCAFILHVRQPELQTHIDALVEAGLVDTSPEGYRMHDWEDWQTRKPSDEPERVKERVSRHREAKRADAPDVTPRNALQNVTETVTPPSVDETPRNALPEIVTPRNARNAREEIRSEEKRLEETDANASAPPKRRAPAHAEQFMALADACHYDTGNLTKDARGRLNDAAAQLDAVGASGADIAAAADALVREWGRGKLSPNSLAVNWPRFARAPANVVNIRPVEKTPVELAWDAASPEEQAIGWQKFIAKYRAEHDDEEVRA